MAAQLKPGVSWDGLAPAGLKIKYCLDQLSERFQCSVVVTCTTRDHKAGSHPKGEAMDVRVIGWTPENTVRYLNWLHEALGPHFYIQLENKSPLNAAQYRGLAVPVVVNKAASAIHAHIQLRQGHTYDPLRDPSAIARPVSDAT